MDNARSESAPPDARVQPAGSWEPEVEIVDDDGPDHTEISGDSLELFLSLENMSVDADEDQHAFSGFGTLRACAVSDPDTPGSEGTSCT